LMFSVNRRFAVYGSVGDLSGLKGLAKYIKASRPGREGGEVESDKISGEELVWFERSCFG
jgi:hypothetical protein